MLFWTVWTKPGAVIASAHPMPVLSSDQEDRIEAYLQRLLEMNKKFNLTAIVDPAEARERHIVECLRLVPLVDELLPPLTTTDKSPERQVLDVGSGGGLPGMVLAIARPDLNFVLLESVAKKARFLDETKAALGLSNVTVLCDRAELSSAPQSKYRESFELVTARAVAALPTLLELVVPFAKPRGQLLLIKGERYREELDAAKNALRLLHCESRRTERHPTATILILDKLERTSKLYPRRSGEPKRKPL